MLRTQITFQEHNAFQQIVVHLCSVQSDISATLGKDAVQELSLLAHTKPVKRALAASSLRLTVTCSMLQLQHCRTCCGERRWAVVEVDSTDAAVHL